MSALTQAQIASTEDAGAEDAHTFLAEIIDEETAAHRAATLADLAGLGAWDESALNAVGRDALLHYCGIEIGPDGDATWAAVKSEFCAAYNRGAQRVIDRARADITAESEAQRLIDRSISHNAIATADYSPDLHALLMTAADDSVQVGDRVEFWTEHWRVHLLRRGP
jgi:hypothetical protein